VGKTDRGDFLMAVLNLYSAGDMWSVEFFYGYVEVANGTTIRLTDGYNTTIYGGTFHYDVWDEVHGTLRSVTMLVDGVKVAEVLGFARDAHAFSELTVLGDAQDALAYVFSGIDRINGSSGNDRLLGYASSDQLLGNDGNDVLLGGPGHDTLSGGAGNDALFGSLHNDTLLGEAGNDTLDGGEHNDFLHGLDGNDRALGWDGDDVLAGGAGFDFLTGGAGRDRLLPGLGRDVLQGGIDADFFIFRTVAEIGSGGGRDIIIDLSALDGDRIDLRSIDANALLPGDQSFTFLGARPFQGAGGEIAQFGHILCGDLDGDRRVDFQLELGSPDPLGAANFLL
jgi:Ca2+-binding RTX toxin-like protein